MWKKNENIIYRIYNRQFYLKFIYGPKIVKIFYSKIFDIVAFFFIYLILFEFMSDIPIFLSLSLPLSFPIRVRMSAPSEIFNFQQYDWLVPVNVCVTVCMLHAAIEWTNILKTHSNANNMGTKSKIYIFIRLYYLFEVLLFWSFSAFV